MHILLAEDESRSAQLLNQLVRGFGPQQLEITTLGSVKEAISAVQIRQPDLFCWPLSSVAVLVLMCWRRLKTEDYLLW